MKIGIDLGTTNSAVAYIDPREAEDSAFPPIHILPIPQYVAPETVEERRTFPSFLFLATGNMWASTRATRVRWFPRGWSIR